jgi:cell division septal protein FtsQ
MLWFKRKPKNRRLESAHLLDVKLSANQVKSARVRMVSTGLTFVLGIGFATLLVWHGGQWLLNRFIYQNPAFAIEAIEVQTDGVIATDYLRRWTMVKPGDNLLGLDLIRVKRDLEMIPFIQSAAVERVLPRTLKVRIIEREPIAQAVILQPRAGGTYEQTAFHLDENGFVMFPLDPRLRSGPPAFPNEQLPMLSGLTANELRPGRQVESPQIRAALQLITGFDRSEMAGVVEIQRIEVAAPEVLQLFTVQGSEIVFSLSDLDRQLRRWRITHEHFQKLGKSIATLDLSIPNNVPLRWVEASAAPAVIGKPVKPSRHRKKNV